MIINIRAWELNCFYYSITWDSQTSCINNQLADSDHHSSRDELSTCSFIQNVSFDLRNNIMRRQFIAFLCNISSLAGNFFFVYKHKRRLWWNRRETFIYGNPYICRFAQLQVWIIYFLCHYIIMIHILRSQNCLETRRVCCLNDLP